MSDDRSVSKQLQANAAVLLAFVNRDFEVLEARSAALSALVHDAEAREHRRAAFNARDASCYRLGSAFEPLGALDIDPVFLTGWLCIGATGLLLLTSIAINHPGRSTAELLKLLATSRAGRQIRGWGVWRQWVWLKELREAETEQFRRSAAFRKARWRGKCSTARQRYCVAKLCEWLQLEPRTFATRGEAFDWLERQGGNPRFLAEPPRLDLSSIGEALS